MGDFSGALSEIEDDPEPEPYQSSGEEWNVNNEEKSATGHRASHRLKKKARIPSRVYVGDSSDSEPNVKSKSSGAKRQKVTRKVPTNGSKIYKDFVTGGFLVSKKDLQTGDAKKHLCLWRIDGKALLQKYEPVVEDGDGKIHHRSTAIYTGWSVLDKDQYSPVSVNVIDNAAFQMVVELNWDTLKSVLDSD